VPTRTNRDDRYFGDKHQAMPAAGYTRMFERMLDHPKIEVRLNLDYQQARQRFSFQRLVFTGPIDEFFGYRFGRLPYRSLRFEHKTLSKRRHQPVAVVNYPQDQDFTRITEYKHLTGQKHPKTAITLEFPTAHGDPFYPIPRAENQALYKRYELLARQTRDTWFVGRLATYQYYNMDQVVGQALSTFKRICAAVPLASAEHLVGIDMAAVSQLMSESRSAHEGSRSFERVPSGTVAAVEGSEL
jgi:UDP-galactopyranose mutase